MLTDLELLRPFIAAMICVSDWGVAASHMAFDCIVLKPEYERRIPIWGDVWHLVAGLRYLAFGTLAVIAFGTEWHWYLATAAVNYLGWQLLKRIHHKPWGTGPWTRWT